MSRTLGGTPHKEPFPPQLLMMGGGHSLLYKDRCVVFLLAAAQTSQCELTPGCPPLPATHPSPQTDIHKILTAAKGREGDGKQVGAPR